MTKKMHTTTQSVLSPYAERLIAQKEAREKDEEIGSLEAAKILGLSRRHMQQILDEGVLLKPGIDFRQLPRKPGSDRGGYFHIKKSAVLRLKGERSS